MRFAVQVGCAVLLFAVGSQAPLPAQWPEGGGQRWAAGGYAGAALGPYGGVHVHEARWAAAGPLGAGAASWRTRVTVGAGGGFQTTTTQKFARFGPEGTSTVEARRVAYGSAGGVRAAGTAFFQATSPEGRSYTYVDRTGLTGDPYGGVHDSEAGGEMAGPFGAVAASSHSRVTVGPGGGFRAATAQSVTRVGAGGTTVQASRMTVGAAGGVHTRSTAYYGATSPGEGSYTSVERRSVTAGPYGAVHAHEVRSATAGPLGAGAGYRGGVTVARYEGTRAVAGGHATRYVSTTTLRTRGAYVRESYSGSTFTAGWYRVHAAAWRPARWRVASIWVAPAWPAVARFCAVSGPPILYDYGSSAMIEGGQVYLDGTQVASAADYADQALAVADSGRQARPDGEEEWQPLGVFGLVQGEEKEPQAIFQLAVNKDGILRGNYYDPLADNNLPVYGAVDPKTQRVAWSVGDKKTVVFEAGLRNLTQEETTALAHYGTTRTRQVALVRLEQPQDEQRSPDEQP
jgi:hypothetical protein